MRETTIRATVLMLLLAVGLLVAPRTATAEEDPRLALQLAEEGKTLFVEAKYEEALRKFEAALGFYDHPKLLFYKARSLVRLERRLEEAVGILRSIAADGRLEQYAPEVPRLIDAAYEKLPPVALDVAVTGASEVRVVLDGATVGAAPWRGAVRRGRHDVAVVGPGCPADPQPLELVDAEPRSLAFRCEVADAEIEVRCAEPGVLVSLDGRAVGRTPLPAPLRVPPGSRRLQLAKDGFGPAERVVALTAGARVVVDLTPVALSGEDDGAQGGDSTWAWVTLGSGVALLGTGGAFLVQHGIDLSNARGATGTHPADTVDSTNLIVGSVTAGVGVGLIVTSFFLWPADDEGAAADVGAPVSFSASPDGGYVSLTLPF